MGAAARPRHAARRPGPSGRTSRRAGASQCRWPGDLRDAGQERRLAPRRRRRRHSQFDRSSDPVSAVGPRGLRRSRRKPARAAHALQAVGWRPPVPDAVRSRVRRAPRAAAHLHLRHRRAAYVSNHLHGRPLASANATPTFYGHSIGWWEGDTLNVETTGFNEGFWIDRRGLPTTEKLRTLEKFTRTDSLTVAYELTIDDPGAYTAPWTSKLNLRWEDGTELFEYVCQQANYAHDLMLGAYESVDRTTVTVPRDQTMRNPS